MQGRDSVGLVHECLREHRPATVERWSATEESAVAARRTERVLAWKGPDPVRVDAAHVTLRPDSLTARGTSAVADYAVDWVLDTGAAWVTRRLSVRARGDGLVRDRKSVV